MKYRAKIFKAIKQMIKYKFKYRGTIECPMEVKENMRVVYNKN